MKFKCEGFTFVYDLPEGSPKEKEAFFMDNFEKLYNGIAEVTDESSGLSGGFQEEITVTTMWIIEAIRYCMLDVLVEDLNYDEQTVKDIVYGKRLVTINSPEEEKEIYRYYDFTARICGNLASKEAIPMLTIQALEREWAKRHGGQK